MTIYPAAYDYNEQGMYVEILSQAKMPNIKIYGVHKKQVKRELWSLFPDLLDIENTKSFHSFKIKTFKPCLDKSVSSESDIFFDTDLIVKHLLKNQNFTNRHVHVEKEFLDVHVKNHKFVFCHNQINHILIIPYIKPDGL